MARPALQQGGFVLAIRHKNDLGHGHAQADLREANKNQTSAITKNVIILSRFNYFPELFNIGSGKF
jgi:hypothetical protein